MTYCSRTMVSPPFSNHLWKEDKRLLERSWEKEEKNIAASSNYRTKQRQQQQGCFNLTNVQRRINGIMQKCVIEQNEWLSIHESIKQWCSSKWLRKKNEFLVFGQNRFVRPKSMTKTVFSVVFWLCQHLIYANTIDNLKQVSMLAALMHFNVTKT